ncbi:MAG TPA: penicillin-binding transpeptidase domain-containing protein [Tepidisphaeraceae bacterium]|jgi:penicillin-binding protein 2
MFERRLQILLIVLGVVCFGLVVRAFSLQVVGRSAWTAKFEEAATDEREIPTVRGRILDVKGRELAVDQPCIDACVHYEAIAATRSLKSIRETAVARLAKADADVTTLPPAELRQRVDAEVAKVVGENGADALKWMRDTARARLKKRLDHYADLPLAERKRLLNAEISLVLADIETMWRELAVLSNQTDEQIDDLRRQILRRVETRRRLVWYKKYEEADKAVAPPWYARWLGAAAADLDKYDVHVSEERDAHVILPHIDYARRNELARRASRYPGLVLREGVRRVYPYESVACQTVGRTSKVMAVDLKDDPRQNERLAKYAVNDDIGREGLERLLEPQLRGTRGLDTDDTDEPDAEPALKPVPGQDVTVTIDVELQARVEQAFKSVDFYVNKSIGMEQLEMPGAAVVIDLPTGEVRAMASWPTYDLNRFDEEYAQLSRDQIRRPLSNRATHLSVEPGSTVKPLVGIAAISSGMFGPRDTIHCDGFLHLNNKKQDFGRCWTMSMFKTTHQHMPSGAPHPTNNLTFAEALQRSCNVFHEELANRMGITAVSHWFDKFGLGRPTGIGLPEAKGLLPDRFEGPAWQRQSIACLAGIGESHVNATPIQMANAAATLARNGVAIRPTLRRGERPEPIDLGVNPLAMAQAREGMYDVVNTPAGTGRAAFLPEVVVAAKTGSAQTGPLRIPRRDEQNKPIRNERGRVIYDEMTLGTHGRPNPRVPWYRATGDDEERLPAHGWMIGYAPAEKPQVAFAVLVEYGGGGGPAAGSVVRKLLRACEELGYVRTGERAGAG